MKKNIIKVLLAAVVTTGVLTGCGAKTENQDTGKTDKGTETAKEEVLEFYHGYFHDENEWPAAKVMRDIYDEFAALHADGPVTFKATPVENVMDIMNNKVASGAFPDLIDVAGNQVSLAAITQDLVLDMKPYIDSEGIQEAVGLNYSQNDINGKIYTVHDQLLTLGYWYNETALTGAGATTPDKWVSWDDFKTAMNTVREGAADGNYAYGSGQGSIRCFNALLGSSEDGRSMINTELNVDTINSEEFGLAFKTIAKLDQENGSQNSGDSANDFSADFTDGKSSVFFNGVWAAGGFAENKQIKPAVFPGNVALSSAGGGITIANGMSEEKTKLALEFVKYMTSDEVQKKIFLDVSANPCNSTLDIKGLAKESGNEVAMLLAEACTVANDADIIVKTIDAAWGTDVQTAISNKLIECSVSGTDIDGKLVELQGELTALIS